VIASSSHLPPPSPTTTAMLKRKQPPLLPPSTLLVTHSKRPHAVSRSEARVQLIFDSALCDELVLSIFTHLSWLDLCAVQAVNREWARLAIDNQVLPFARPFLAVRC
jgi:hypothetical protein